MRSRVMVAVFFVLSCLPSAAEPHCAGEILAKAKQSSGGDAWDVIRTTYSKVNFSTGGLTGPAESWEDNLTGRYVERYQLGPASGADGFDGKMAWSQDSSGEPRPEGAEGARQAAADEAYRKTMAYWFPQRWTAQIECFGKKEEQGKAFDVLRITPQGGRPFDLWIDAVTHLIDHTVERAEIETRTTYFSDYRTVAGVKVPFAMRSTNGEQKYDQYITLEKVDFNVPIREAQYRMPEPPPPDFAIAGGKSSTNVAFELLNNHIYVEVKLNHKGPYQMLCDTGGANIITPTLAQELGLKSEGALQGRGVGEKSEDVGLVKIASVNVSDATLSNQVFAVYPMEALSAVEGIPIKGLIGYEMFKRFVARVDYEHHLITLTLPSAFAYKGEGTVVPFKFNEHIPQVDGAIDGIEGKFDIDTGSRSSLDLMGPFVEKYDLAARYGAKLESVTGWGVGGAARSLVTRAKVLRLGEVEIPNPVTELSLQKKGAFTSQYVAGNVGAGVLKRFNITFDYPHQQLVFEPNVNYGKPDAFDRSGMWLNQSEGVFEVMDVTAGGPSATAGLKPGDKIVAIDGHPVSQLSLPAVREQFKSEPAGTKMRLTVETGGQEQEIDLILRDLV